MSEEWVAGRVEAPPVSTAAGPVDVQEINKKAKAPVVTERPRPAPVPVGDGSADIVFGNCVGPAGATSK